MLKHHSINYLEIPVRNLSKTKAFFNEVFGWQFQDYGVEYACFLDVGINGGFYQASENFNLDKGCPLIVLYSKDLPTTEQKVVKAGGQIIKETFSFPGGRRFHFADLNGNEYAVWSE